jgi:hypothetical protein
MRNHVVQKNVWEIFLEDEDLGIKKNLRIYLNH